MMRLRAVVLLVTLMCTAASASPSSPVKRQGKAAEGTDRLQSSQLPPLIIPVIEKDEMNERLIPIGSTDGARTARGNRTARFFGLTTTGSNGNNLQLGLSFIVPFLNIPFPGSSQYGGTYGTTPAYGTTTTSLLGFNTGNIIIAVVIAIAAIIIIPFIVQLTTGVSTSPFGRSDNIQDILTNLAVRVDEALQQYNIDAPTCLQRAVCTYIKTSAKRMTDGTAGSTEKIIEGLATNEYLNSVLDGTKLLEAMNAARKSSQPCSAYHTKCPYNINTIYNALSQYASLYGQYYNNQQQDPLNNAVHLH